MVALSPPPQRSWLWSPPRPPWYLSSPYHPPYHVSRQTWRRLVRIAAAGLVVSLVLVLRLACAGPRERPHHAPFETPHSDLVVHGRPVKLLPEPLYPLEPFPDSPVRSHPSSPSTAGAAGPDGPAAAAAAAAEGQQGGGRPCWLVTVISPANDAARRMLIRSTWMRLYRDVPFTARFVVSNPGPRWTDNIRMENRTFGDMIVLDHLQEDDVTANTVKTIELYRWLISRGHRYEFVSKMDTDLWFNARGFWDRYLSRLLTNRTGTPEAAVRRTLIGELYYSKTHDLVFPHGAMYTATWDMVELLSSLQSRFNVVTGEDMAVAMLMLKGRETANLINFRGSEKFDYLDGDSRGDGTAWARRATHPEATRHAVHGTDAIAVHELKDERLFLKVADCFDGDGVRGAPDPPPRPEARPPLLVLWWDFLHTLDLTVSWKSRFERIPDFLWSFDNDRWVCDGIWSLGRTRTGHIDEQLPLLLH